METIRFFCPSCGARLSTAGRLAPGESIHCPKCGTSFVPPQLQADLGDEVLPATPLPRRGASQTSKHGSSLVLILCLVVVGLILLGSLVAGGVFLLYRLQSEPVNSSAKGAASALAQAAETSDVESDLKLDTWLQDLEEAKPQAAKDKKDILILLNDTAFTQGLRDLGENVLTKAEFQQKILPHFVPVYVPLPHSPVAWAKVKHPQQNVALHQRLAVGSYPSIVLADPQGRPYAFKTGFIVKEADTYCASLEKLREVRVERDKLLANFEKLRGADKLRAHQELLAYLKKQSLTDHYRPLITEGAQLARQVDAANDQGILETYFEMEWTEEVKAISSDAGPERKAALDKCISRMNAWKSSKRFKDPNRAAEMYLKTATFLETEGKPDEAFEFVDEAIGYQPTKNEILQQLAMHMYRLGIGGGTGFAIAPGGYLLTNYHVVNNARQVRIRVPQLKRSVAVEVVASDTAADIALLRLRDVKGIDLKPLPLAAKRTIHRGEPVAVLGFPLGDMVGSGLKLTTGVVSSTPEPGNTNKLVLDAKVNPGNSGGPLLDAYGAVIGVVSAKSFGFGQIESYGLAIPSPEVEAFLQKHLKGYQAAEAPPQKIDWQEVNHRASPSVLMVLHLAKLPPRLPGFIGQIEPDEP